MTTSEASSAPRMDSRSTGRLPDGRLSLAGRLALVVVCLAVFLSALDQTVVVTALERMIGDLGVPLTRPDRAAWIVSAYLLGYVVAMPLMGRIADRSGRRLVFAASLTLFALGSVVCGLAPALGNPIAPDYTTLGGALLSPFYNAAHWLLDLAAHFGVDTSLPALDILIAARFVQAIGGGALVPVSMAVVGDLFGTTRRGLALGLVGAVAEAGGVVGPLWGAWITTRWGWQWIFFVNVPLAALLLVVGLLALPVSQRTRGGIDALGALVFGAALTCLSLGFGPQNGQIDVLHPGAAITPNPLLLVAAVGLLALFVALELLLRSPVIDVRLFQRRAFGAAAALSFLVGIALIVAMVLIPLFVISLAGGDALAGGLALLRLTALVPIGALLGGWLSSRFGCPPAAVFGVVLAAAGLYLMSLWPAHPGTEQVTIATVLAGLGFGLVIAPISTSALNAAGAAKVGMAAAVVTVLRMTGMIVGLAWLTLWALTRIQALFAAGGLPTDPIAAATFVLHQVYSEIFLLTALIALVGLAPALLLWRRDRAQAAAPEAEQVIESFVAPLA